MRQNKMKDEIQYYSDATQKFRVIPHGYRWVGKFFCPSASTIEQLTNDKWVYLCHIYGQDSIDSFFKNTLKNAN